MENDNLIETTLESETVFEGKVFDCLVKKVKLCDGSTSRREIVKHNGGACILPVDSENNAYVVRQFRSPFERVLMEVPAGKLEKDEDPRVCAIRELKEETGFVSENVVSLGSMVCSPGYCSEVIGLFMATDLKYEGAAPDEGEFLNVEKIPFSELLKMVENNEIEDAKSQICILKAARRLGL